MDTWQARLQKRLNDESLEARLINWGRWCRQPAVNLGYPTWPQIMQQYYGATRAGKTICELDAIHLEYVISTLDITGRDGFGFGELYAFILKVEYVERPDHKQRPVSIRAEDVRRKFKRPCAERTYYAHLAKAKIAVAKLAIPI